MTSTASPAPALLALRDAIDAHWPQRSKASDGILGDAAHQARKSDHNEGNALDITHDPVSGPDLEALADLLIGDPRTHYVIWNKRIRNMAFEGGAWRPYNGASPHTAHLHVSVVAEHREDASPWRLPGDPPPESAAPAAAEGEVTPAGDGRVAGVVVASLGLLVVVALLARHDAQQGRKAPRPAWARGWG